MKLRWPWVLLIALGSVAAGCERDRRIPYVPPDLAGWERPYRGSNQLSLHAFDIGTLKVPAALFGGESLTGFSELDLFAFVIFHRQKGIVVFDPGPGKGCYGAEAGGDSAGGLLEFTAPSGVDLESQMRSAGMEPARVVMVLASSLHFYRAGGAPGFESAALGASAEEREAAARRSLVSFYRPRELDKVERWRFLEMPPTRPYATFASHLDLFGDGTLIVLPTPGYTAGGISLLVRLRSRPLLLLGDFAWSENSLRFASIPRTSADRDAWWDSVWRVKRFADLAPELVVVPGAGLGPLARAAELPKEVVLHRSTSEDKEGS